MSTITPTPIPALLPGVVYVAHDRLVCSDVTCCGSTALYTRKTVDGIKLRPVAGRDVIEFARPGRTLTCECGRLAVRFSMYGGLRTEVVR